MTAMEFPWRMLPPTNSLPPLRCPWPAGLEGDDIGLREFGVVGGLKSVGAKGSWGRAAPGLKVKAGRASVLEGPRPISGEGMGDLERGSIADKGLLLMTGPVAVERGEVEARRGGKTKCGFGGGISCRLDCVGEAVGFA